ncbi:MAG: hypothetical protein H6Q73_1132 [Firmicutes bacterium]|nr:hypothetical protein [Bacillota bacterium]
MKKRLRITIGVMLIVCFCSFQNVYAAESNWIWYYSSDYVSDFYNPESLNIVKDYNGNIDHVELCIKTTYSEAGKNNAINNHRLTEVPKINDLKFKLAQIYIYPSQGKILFQHEAFFDEGGRVLWSKESTVSDSFEFVPGSANERYYSIISDLAFHNSQQVYFLQWKENKDRWVGLTWYKNADGSESEVWFDKLSVTLNGDCVKVWKWGRTILDNEVIGNSYYLVEYDLSNKKSKPDIISSWTKDKGRFFQHDDNQPWNSIIIGSKDEYEFQTIKKYVDEHRAEIIENMHIK